MSGGAPLVELRGVVVVNGHRPRPGPRAVDVRQARPAFGHGYRTTIVSDAVSSRVPDRHRATLETFAAHYGWVLPTEAVLEGLTARADRAGDNTHHEPPRAHPGHARRPVMPVVRIEMYDGRSLDQKRQLVKEVTDTVARITGNSPEGVHVIIDEVKRENWAIGGQLWPDRQAAKAAQARG